MRLSRSSRLIGLVVFLCSLSAAASAQTTAGWLDVPVPPRPDAKAVDLEAGRRAYGLRCAPCHGVSGQGDGAAAPYLDPRPRDFTKGFYKLRTTKSGELPTDEDLYRTLSFGMSGSSMPSWSHLSVQERWDLVGYVKSFNEDFADPEFSPYRTEDGETFIEEIPQPPPASPALLQQGREIYLKAKCQDCHGEGGRLEGSRADGLKDDLGLRLWPRDITRPWNYRGGASPRELYRTFTTGFAGTPMPSFAGSLVAGDAAADRQARWALAQYVRSLQLDRRSGTVLKVKRALGALPTGPDDAAWKGSEELDVPLFGQVIVKPRWQTPAVDLVRVRALYSEDEIAIRLQYADPRENRSEAGLAAVIQETYAPLDLTRDIDKHPDQVALQFPAQLTPGVERPYLLYGQPGQAVTLWRYHADHAAAVRWKAEGPAAIAELPAPQQRVSAKGLWRNGEWTVVFTRPLYEAGEGDAQFAPGQMTPFSLMAWEGAHGEHGLLHSLSSWYHLDLEAEVGAGAYAQAFFMALLVALIEWGLVRAARRGRGD